MRKFLGLLLLATCLRAQTRVEEGNRLGILHLGNGAEPESLDPHLTTGVAEYRILQGLLEGLVREDPVTLEPIPGVAERWEVSEDGKTFLFHFRGDARWSNGDPVTAGDFVYSFRRMLSPALATEYAYMLHVLEGAKAFHAGESQELPGAVAINELTLRLRLAQAAPYFLGMLNHHAYYPVHPPTIEKFGGSAARATPWARVGSYVGNGPFRLAEWAIHQHIRLEKSDSYWNRNQVRLNGIVFYAVEDTLSEERMFRAGLLHKTEDVPLPRIDGYRKEPGGVFWSQPYLTTYYYLFNTTRKPFDDVRVRQALSLSIQRSLLTERVLKAGQLPALWFTPPGTGGFTPSQKIEEDLDRARALLAEAGYPGGKGFPKFTLLYNTREQHRTIAQVLQQMWKKNLGIECDLLNQEWQVYMVSRREGKYDVARAGWAGDYADPHNFLDLFLSASGNNHTGWSDPAYDALIHRAEGSADKKERFALYDQAEALLLRDMPVLPIYWYTRNYLISPSVKGWAPNILDRQDYPSLWLEAKP